MKYNNYRAIVIGGSAGSIEAISKLLATLPADFSLPIFIVQHQIVDMPNDGFLEHYYSEHGNLPVHEAVNGMMPEPGHVYLSVPGYHLLVEKDYSISLSVDPPVNYTIPSVDVLFETASEVYRSGLIGIILTGANSDGSYGLKKIKAQGGLALVQDPSTALAKVMPQSAIDTVQIDQVLPIEKIGEFLVTLSRKD